MVGKFNDTLFFVPGTHHLNVAGVLTCDSADAGKQVTIDVTSLQQNGFTVSCHKSFVIPPTCQLNWSMEVSASHFGSGTAAGAATATVNSGAGQPFSWIAPDPNVNPQIPPINIS